MATGKRSLLVVALAAGHTLFFEQGQVTRRDVQVVASAIGMISKLFAQTAGSPGSGESYTTTVNNNQTA